MITNEQVEQRRKYIGASDVPAIMGLSSFLNTEISPGFDS